ncbi:MAG: hypothetical protein SFU21_01920 [Flavihumibacter sp.]|nr:hypothetical protein [Flavihumibacter sp.]
MRPLKKLKETITKQAVMGCLIKSIKMADSLKWKDRFLSSGIPLEFEVAKLLSRHGFSTSYDYSYQRLDNKEEKEFSIDIYGHCFYPFEEHSAIENVVRILVECKFRNPQVKWFFIPSHEEDDFDSHTMRSEIKLVDEFSPYTFPSKNKLSAPLMKTALKGVEVNIHTGEVHETGILHGTNQLTYGLPVLLNTVILESSDEAIDECYPQIIIPILVTTSELFLLNNDVTIKSVSNVKDLKEIAIEVPYLRLCSNLYSSFKTHCRNIFADIFDFNDNRDNYELFSKLRIMNLDFFQKNDAVISSPKHLLKTLSLGTEDDFFKEIIVCNFSNLNKLISEIKVMVDIMNKSKIDLRKVK